MLRDEPTIRPNLYRLPQDQIGQRILVPAFRQAKRVSGAFGWFSAGWIARLAHGLAVFLNRDEAEPIEFVIAPVLFSAEYDALKDAVEREAYLYERFDAFLLEGHSPSATTLTRHAVDCLAWMVVHGRLILRIAKPHPGANYHPKIWLFADDDDTVAVRGSANATGRAYGRGVEHMDVDCTWDNRARVESAMAMVDDWIHGRDDQLEAVLDLPAALKDTVHRLAPEHRPTEDDYEAAMESAMSHPDVLP